MNENNIIEVENLHKSFGSLEVLKGVNLKVQKGEIVAVVGKSGAGKTTLLQIIGTLDKPTSGIVRIDGIDIFRLEIGGIGLEPAAESVGADACERGKLGFGVGFHFAFSNRVATGFALLNNATDASALCIANLHYVSVYATSPLCCERE